MYIYIFPGGSDGKESACNAGVPGSIPGSGHCSVLAWRIPWTEEPSGLQSMSHKKSDTTEWLTLSLFNFTWDPFHQGFAGSLKGKTGSHLTLCNPLDCSPLGSSVHGIFQGRILEWVAIPFSRGSFWTRSQTRDCYYLAPICLQRGENSGLVDSGPGHIHLREREEKACRLSHDIQLHF